MTFHVIDGPTFFNIDQIYISKNNKTLHFLKIVYCLCFEIYFAILMEFTPYHLTLQNPFQ